MTITATNLASGTFRRVRGDISRTASSVKLSTGIMKAGFATALVGAVGLFAGIAALKGAFALAATAGEFQQGIAAVGAVANATTQELASLRDAAIQAGIETQFSPTEAVEGLTSLITAGQTATQATETLIPVLDLAAGSLGQLGVAGAAAAVVGTLNSYQLSAGDAANVTDRLLRITQLTNFQTRDFETGLAKAASAGAVFGQDLNDVLITMGLLRNANIDASSSSTAFRESVRRLGSDQRAQNAITAEGVDIFDEQTGEMRSVVDIMNELTIATADMGDEERNRIAATAFGARGLLAFNAVSKATFTTMRDGVEVTLEGAEAIAALRGELESATGTAEEFREKLLDTFAGQKQLLEGTIQTLAIVLGESFARLFKPFVAAIVDGLNAILRFFNELPDPVKDAISAFITFAAVGMILFGVFVLVAGIVLILISFLKGLIITMALMAVVMIPLTIAFVGLGAIIAGFVVAARSDIGGFGAFLKNAFGKAKLAFQGLVQVFTTGRFSGAVRDELLRAENEGVLRFVVTLFRIGSRIIEFFRGVRAAFSAALVRMAPLFKRLRDAFIEVGQALGIIGESVEDNLGDLSGAAESGANFGVFLSRMFETVVSATTMAVRAFGGFIRGAKRAFEFFAPVFEQLKLSFRRLGNAIADFQGDAADNFGNAADGAGSMGETMGEVWASIVTGFAFVATTFLDFATFFIGFVRTINRNIQKIDIFFTRLAISVREKWMNIADAIRGAMDIITIAIGKAAGLVPASVRPASLQGLVEAGQQAEVNFQSRIVQGRVRSIGIEQRRGELTTRSAEIDVQASNREARDASLVKEVREALVTRREEERAQAIQVTLQVDGEAIATAAGTGAVDAAARGFNSSPAAD